ncbi:hypothetical protein CG709_01230, partial [Lachnotalea glycerini]
SRKDSILEKIADTILLNDFTIISQEAMYQKRGKKKTFEDTIATEENATEDLSLEEILKLNQNKNRYSKKEIESFILQRMEQGVYTTNEASVKTQGEFELLILAYDYSIRKKSPFRVNKYKQAIIQNDRYSYPKLTFELKKETLQENKEERDDSVL